MTRAAAALTDEAAAALLALLDAGQAQSCEYGEGLSNHLPMSLASLQRLGASGKRLRAFAAQYSERLGAADAPEAWPAGDPWAARLGDRTAFAAYRHLFALWRDEEGASRVLEQSLPRLMQGCSGAAFQGLIRTACAVQSRHAGEFVSGLAYWACRWQTLAAVGGSVPSVDAATVDDPEQLLATLPRVASRQPLIADRMRHAASRVPAIAQRAQLLGISTDTLPRLAMLAAQAYAQSGNLTALYLVTSAHAVRVLSPYFDEPESALRHYWLAYAHAVAVAGFHVVPPVPMLSWQDIEAQALASNDEQVIELVDSCRQQAAAYPALEAGHGQPWQRAASRAAGAG